MPLLNGSDVMKKKAEERSIYITEFDLTRLEELLDKIDTEGSRDSRHLQELEDELLRAEVVEPQQIPADVVTMNSRVALKDLATGEEMVYELVFPSDARLEENRISILAPVGTALLGYRAGDTISWKVPGGTRKIKITKILYQPEAAGDFHR
ncbi:nucleoside diphosphate kinase regulator [Geobacter sulfurreducens subsp. ethanolicus]|nr:nucleoside diphosphate kinase regulator [Geobacter sulfurreducens subsp. ethanolicus]BET59118.1 nucleoside diphosphate kinase regulator [Geobacter sp. 60473]